VKECCEFPDLVAIVVAVSIYYKTNRQIPTKTTLSIAKSVSKELSSTPASAVTSVTPAVEVCAFDVPDFKPEDTTDGDRKPKELEFSDAEDAEQSKPTEKHHDQDDHLGTRGAARSIWREQGRSN
jgi:hypothetical protein